MATEYLSQKTELLKGTEPVPPSQARTAQIPLQSFTLPTFPAEAFSSSTNLSALILTSDIKLDEYTQELSKPFSIPDLPSTIKSLTLELFSLGFPPGWLSTLGEKLKGLRSLTCYSQLLAGTTKGSRDDALAFIKEQTQLRELHLLDVFLPPGFLPSFSNVLNKNLKFLEINYTFRHSDPEFLRSLNAGEILDLVKDREGLVGLNLGIGNPDVVKEDEDDREGTEVGVLVISGEGERVLRSLKGKRKEDLRMVDLGMFELRSEEVGRVLDECEEVVVAGFSVGLEERGWEGVFEGLKGMERGVEVLELVGVPGSEVVEKLKGGGQVGFSKEMVESLGGMWKGLRSLKGSVLRTKGEEWIRVDAGWVKKV